MPPPQTLGCPTLPTMIETQQHGFFRHVTKVLLSPCCVLKCHEM